MAALLLRTRLRPWHAYRFRLALALSSAARDRNRGDPWGVVAPEAVRGRDEKLDFIESVAHRNREFGRPIRVRHDDPGRSKSLDHFVRKLMKHAVVH